MGSFQTLDSIALWIDRVDRPFKALIDHMADGSAADAARVIRGADHGNGTGAVKSSRVVVSTLGIGQLAVWIGRPRAARRFSQRVGR